MYHESIKSSVQIRLIWVTSTSIIYIKCTVIWLIIPKSDWIGHARALEETKKTLIDSLSLKYLSSGQWHGGFFSSSRDAKTSFFNNRFEEYQKSTCIFRTKAVGRCTVIKALVTNTLTNVVRTIFDHLRNGKNIVRTAFARVFVTKAWPSIHIEGIYSSEIIAISGIFWDADFPPYPLPLPPYHIILYWFDSCTALQQTLIIKKKLSQNLVTTK